MVGWWLLYINFLDQRRRFFPLSASGGGVALLFLPQAAASTNHFFAEFRPWKLSPLSLFGGEKIGELLRACMHEAWRGVGFNNLKTQKCFCLKNRQPKYCLIKTLFQEICLFSLATKLMAKNRKGVKRRRRRRWLQN